MKTRRTHEGVMFSRSTLLKSSVSTILDQLTGITFDELIATLSQYARSQGLILIKTKGKGYEPAEKTLMVSTVSQNLIQLVDNCLNQTPNQPIQKSLAIGLLKWQNKTIN